MKFKAFTLAEVMMFLVVVSVLLSIIFATLKPQQVIADKNIKYKYAAVYDALNLAIYDMMDKEETNPFEQIETPEKGFKKLCTVLSDYINATTTNCNNPLPQNVTYMTDEDFDFRTIKQPHIAALNGINLYFSELITDDVTPNADRSYYNEENPDFTLKFYMVYADLNGQDDPKRPHSILYNPESKRHPSVHAFAIIPTGEAIPIGVAEYNIKYLATRVAYKEDRAIYYSPYYSLHQAKHAAWDWYKTGNSNVVFNDKISFTYNDYIKEILERKSSQLYKFNNENIFPETYDNDMFSKCVPTGGTALTVYDMCSITVDTLNFGATN